MNSFHLKTKGAVFPVKYDRLFEFVAYVSMIFYRTTNEWILSSDLCSLK